MNRKTFRERQRAAIRSMLISAAERVAAQMGLKATTVRQIANEAGCAPGTLYIYFHGKRDLLQAVATRTERKK